MTKRRLTKHLDDPGSNIKYIPFYGSGSGGAANLPTANATSVVALGLANLGSTGLAPVPNPHVEQPYPIADASPVDAEMTGSEINNAIFGGFNTFGFHQAATHVNVDRQQYSISLKCVPTSTSGLPYQSLLPSFLIS